MPYSHTCISEGSACASGAVVDRLNRLVSFLDNLEANEEERVWLKRQSDGELDEHRLTEGLTGEASIYKRRGLDKRASSLFRH